MIREKLMQKIIEKHLKDQDFVDIKVDELQQDLIQKTKASNIFEAIEIAKKMNNTEIQQQASFLDAVLNKKI